MRFVMIDEEFQARTSSHKNSSIWFITLGSLTGGTVMIASSFFCSVGSEFSEDWLPESVFTPGLVGGENSAPNYIYIKQEEK